MGTQEQMLDTGMAPEIYCDGIGSVDSLGSNCRTNFFTWARMPGSAILERVVVLKLIRPVSALRSGTVMAMLEEQVACQRLRMHA